MEVQHVYYKIIFFLSQYDNNGIRIPQTLQDSSLQCQQKTQPLAFFTRSAALFLHFGFSGDLNKILP